MTVIFDRYYMKIENIYMVLYLYLYHIVQVFPYFHEKKFAFFDGVFKEIGCTTTNNVILYFARPLSFNGIIK